MNEEKCFMCGKEVTKEDSRPFVWNRKTYKKHFVCVFSGALGEELHEHNSNRSRSKPVS